MKEKWLKASTVSPTADALGWAAAARVVFKLMAAAAARLIRRKSLRFIVTSHFFGRAGDRVRRPWLPNRVLYQSRIKLTRRDPDRLLPDVD
jgi:hypothetical protein